MKPVIVGITDLRVVVYMFNSHFLHIKIAGGATAQILGLMNAIFASQKLRIPFKISYYPYSTGTYWPCVLEKFLSKDEILNLNVQTKGLKDVGNLEVGKIIKTHPLMFKNMSTERIISILRKTKILSFLEVLKRERAIHGKTQRLMKISLFYKSISGGFATINEEMVNNEMHSRFLRAGLKSPFSKSLNENTVVIHYRLGDRRAIHNHSIDYIVTPILNPKSFTNLIKDVTKLNHQNIWVVSDEPEVAKELLSQVGVVAKIREHGGSIWEDLYFMSQADIFIGSNSQVSRLANICVEINGGSSYMLNLEGIKNYKKFPNTIFLESEFLPSSHEIYNPDFVLSEESHSSYKIAKPTSN